MTNEEVIKELMCKNCTCINVCRKEQYLTPCEKYKYCMQIAQWKDEQMKEALNNILIECDACFDEQTTNTLESIIKHQISLL